MIYGRLKCVNIICNEIKKLFQPFLKLVSGILNLESVLGTLKGSIDGLFTHNAIIIRNLMCNLTFQSNR